MRRSRESGTYEGPPGDLGLVLPVQNDWLDDQHPRDADEGAEDENLLHARLSRVELTLGTFATRYLPVFHQNHVDERYEDGRGAGSLVSGEPDPFGEDEDDQVAEQ